MTGGQKIGWTGAAAVLCTLVPATLLRGQENEEPVRLDPLNVTAGRFDSELKLVPASALVADADYLREMAAMNMADVLEDMGVLMRSYTGNPSQTSIDMRGFGETGNLNVLVLVDGQRINAPDMSGINWLDLPLASVDRVEIIRGAQTALYGNNAAGGVILITTSLPDKPGGNAQASAGSFGTLSGRASAWSPAGPVRVRAELGYEESDGYRVNSGYESSSARLSVAGGGSLAWRFNASGGKTSLLYPGPLDDATFLSDPRSSPYDLFRTLPDGSRRYIGDEYAANIGNYLVSASLDGRGDESELHADSAFRRRDLEWNLDGVFGNSTLDTWTLGPRWRMDSGSLSLTLGGDAEYDKLDFERYRDIERTQFRGRATLDRRLGAAYVHSLLRVGDSFSTTATARGQWHSLEAGINELGASPVDEDAQGSDFGASLGATWDATPDLRLWGRVDRFFRYPALDEIAAYQGYPQAVPFNSGLESEKGWGAELGTDWGLDGLLLRLTVFAQDVEDLIAYDYTRNLNVNLADAWRTGAEASAQWRSEHWSAGVFYTLLHTELSSGAYAGSDLYLVPRHQVNAHLTWIPSDRASLRCGLRYVGSSRQGNDLDNSLPRLPPYAVADLTLRMRLDAHWHVFGRVDNLFNRHYATLLYSGGWYPAASRSYQTGIQLDF